MLEAFGVFPQPERYFYSFDKSRHHTKDIIHNLIYLSKIVNSLKWGYGYRYSSVLLGEFFIYTYIEIELIMLWGRSILRLNMDPVVKNNSYIKMWTVYVKINVKFMLPYMISDLLINETLKQAEIGESGSKE